MMRLNRSTTGLKHVLTALNVLIFVLLSGPIVRASVIGVPLPKPTAANQHPVSIPFAGGFTWSPVTLPYGVNGTGQMAVGGTVDATTRLSVNPQGTAENGVSVTMPSGATGYGVWVKDSTGVVRFSVGTGRPYFSVQSYLQTQGVMPTGSTLPGLVLDGNDEGNSPGSQGALLVPFYNSSHNCIGVTLGAGQGFLSSGTMRADGGFNTSSSSSGLTMTGTGFSSAYPGRLDYNGYQSGNPVWRMYQSGGLASPLLSVDGVNTPAQVPLTVKAASGQTADLTDFNTSAGTNIAKVSNGGGLTNTGYSLTNALSAPTGLAVTTAGTAGTTTYRYYIVAVSGTGVTTVSNEAVVTTANATLTSTNYNAVSWTATPGAESYSLYRTLSGGATGSEGLIVAGLTSVTYNDYYIPPASAGGWTASIASAIAVNGSYIPVTGAYATLNGATQYTNGTYFLGYTGTTWIVDTLVNNGATPTCQSGTAGATATNVPPSGWAGSPSCPTPPIFAVIAGSPSAGATYPTVNTTGYDNAASYQVGGVAGVTTTLADGSAVTKGIVTAPGTTIVSNGSQVTVGGAIDTATRLSVNPQGAAENGLTVKMPSGATGNALQVKNSTGTVVTSISATGTLALPGSDSSNNPGFHFTQAGTSINYGGNIGIGLDPSYDIVANAHGFLVSTAFSSVSPFTVIATGSNATSTFAMFSGQTGDILDFNTSGGTNLAKVSNGGGLTNTGYSLTNALSAPTGLSVTTAGTAGTTTYRYYVVAVSGTGVTTVSNEAVVTTANATLSSTNYNAVSWTAVAGAESYSLYRTLPAGASGAEGLIVAGLTGTTYADYIAPPVGAVTGYTVAGAGTTAANGTYAQVTGVNATSSGAPQYTNTTYFLTFYGGSTWGLFTAPNAGTTPSYSVSGTSANVPLTGWATALGTAPAPTLTTITGAPVPGATYPTVNTTGYHNAASYQVGGVSGVTATLADGSAVTKGIVTGVPKGTLTAISTKTAAYTVTVNDNTILMNGAFAVTLPAASATLTGHSWTVKQIGAASSTVVGTVDGNTAGYTLAAQFNFVTIVTDGVSYYIVGKG